MTYQIDQSGKIEDTNKLTVVAYADGKVKSITISSSEKQKLMNTMRGYDRPGKAFIFKAFAGLVYLLLKDENIKEVQIDKEYPGHEPLIKDLILQLFRKDNLLPPKIDFAFIGKDSPAHKIALEVYRGLKKPDKKISAKDILKLFYAKKKGWSSHSR